MDPEEQLRKSAHRRTREPALGDGRVGVAGVDGSAPVLDRKTPPLAADSEPKPKPSAPPASPSDGAPSPSAPPPPDRASSPSAPPLKELVQDEEKPPAPSVWQRYVAGPVRGAYRTIFGGGSEGAAGGGDAKEPPVAPGPSSAPQVKPASEKAPAAAEASVSGDGKDQEPQECPICMDDIDPTHAVARCSGEHGRAHHFHARCLQEWVSKSARDSRMRQHGARCPVCRGSVQVHRGRVRTYIENKAVDEEQRGFFSRLLGQLKGSEEDGGGWSELTTFDKLVTVAQYAGLALTAAHGFQAGWRYDWETLTRTGDVLRIGQAIEAESKGEDPYFFATRTVTGRLRTLHFVSGLAGMSARTIMWWVCSRGKEGQQSNMEVDSDDDD